MSNHLQICLIVPKRLAKSTKSSLERRAALDKTSKIQASTEGKVACISADGGQEIAPTHLIIPTVQVLHDGDEFNGDYDNLKRRVLRELGFEGQCTEISLVLQAR